MVSGGGGIPSNRKRVNLILSFSHKGTDERKDARVEKTKEGKSAVNLYASRQRSKSATSQIHHTLTLSHSHTLTLSCTHTLTLMGKVNILNPVLQGKKYTLP